MRIFGFVGVLAFFVLLSGCVVSVEKGEEASGGGYPDRGRESATLAEIDAASELTFNKDQERIYIGIASRPYLSGRTQVHLVNKAMQSLTFNDSKLDVLLALVNNPCFVADGKQAVLENLDALTFESSKRKVLEAINRREPVPTERQLRRRLEHLQEPQQGGTIEMETTVQMQAEYLRVL